MIGENEIDRLIQEYLDGTLDPHGRRTLEEAIERDPRVAERVQEYRWMHGALPETFGADDAPSADLADRVVRELETRQGARLRDKTLEALAGRSRIGARMASARRRGREAGPGLVPWLVAAGILFGFATLLLLSSTGAPVRRPVPPERPVARPKKTPAPAPRIAADRARPIVTAPQTPPIPSRENRRGADRPLLKDFHPERVQPDRPAPEPEKPAPAPAPRRPEQTVATVATIKLIEGTAPVLLGADARPLKTDDTLQEGQGLRLDPESAATLRFPDGTFVRVSGAVLEDLRTRGGKRMRLTKGRLEADVARQPARGPFVIQTPNAEARVLGTILTLVVEPGRTRLNVAKGRVRLLRSRDGMSVLVGADHFAVAAPGVPLVAERIKPDVQTLWISAVDRSVRISPPMNADRTPPAGSLSGRPVYAAADNRSVPAARRASARSLAPDSDDGGWAAYTVRIPSTGEWFLWARLFAPGEGVLWRKADGTGDDPNSFYVRIDGGPERILGNLRSDPATGRSYYRRWYWGGDGRREEGKPTALALGTLSAGDHVIRIRNRDAVETASLRLSPRLDVICLTRDPAYVPRDAEVRLGR